MKKHEFKTVIDAPREKVWDILWGDETYPAWTSAFSEGSKAETDWRKGSKVYFTDGQGQGMVALIDEKIPNEYMSFRHVGQLVDGKEDLESEKVKEWAGSMENYTLKDANGKTELVVDIDINDEWVQYFTETWPKALDKLKDMAEKN